MNLNLLKKKHLNYEIMKISQLPQEVKEKALEYQRNADEGWNKTTDILESAFIWRFTKEGVEYWYEWCVSEFKETTK